MTIDSALLDSLTAAAKASPRLRQRDPELGAVWGTICTPHQSAQLQKVFVGMQWSEFVI